MSLFCIGDLHFSEAVQKPMDVFGRRWSGYREKIINNWNAVVGENDTVVVPGDISWGLTLDEAIPDLRLLDSLKGKKIILRGNHDYWWQSVSKINKAMNENGITSISLIQNNSVTYGDYALCGSRGWFCEEKKAPEDTDYEKISAREGIRLDMSLSLAEEGKQKITFLHFPPVYKSFVCRPLIEVMKKHCVSDCWYCHLHGVYDLPRVLEFEGIRLHPASADYLNFLPEKILP